MKNSIGLILVFIALSLHGQEIDILIKNGHVFDAKNNIDTISDVSIADGKIVEVAPSLSGKDAKKVIDATGLYVVPCIYESKLSFSKRQDGDIRNISRT